MNFNFEGNYKAKRNINLGGVRTHDDRRSLMAKAQRERRAREQERIRLQKTIKIQAFYRRYRATKLLHQQLREDFEQLLSAQSTDRVNALFTLTRQLILFYRPSDSHYITLYTAYLLSPYNHSTLLNYLFTLKGKASESWVWLVCLLAKKVILPDIKSNDSGCYLLSVVLNPSCYPDAVEDRHRLRIMNYTIYHTPILETLGYIISTSEHSKQDAYSLLHYILLSTMHPSFQSTTALPLMVATHLLKWPFFIDNLSRNSVHQFIQCLSYDSLLNQTIVLLQGTQHELDDTSIAGLLMNITQLGDIDSGILLKNSFANYAKTLQLILTRLPIEYLFTRPDDIDTKIIDEQDSDLSDESEKEDVEMEEIPVRQVSPIIKERLEAFYDKKKMYNLLYRFNEAIKITADRNDMVKSVASLFNTIMIRWPSKKDLILNTLLYKSSMTRDLLQLLWEIWNKSEEALLFNEYHMMHRLTEAAGSITDPKVSSASYPVLFLLCEIYTRVLLTISDDEFLEKREFFSSTYTNPLQLNQVIQLGQQLKNMSFTLFWQANDIDLNRCIPSTSIQISHFRSTITHLLQQIHLRDSRRSFCPSDHWLIPDLDTDNFSSAAVAEEFNLENDKEEDEEEERRPVRVISRGRMAVISPRLGILNNIPFVIPFEQRVEIFRMFVENDRERNNIADSYFRPSSSVTIRRNHMFEDGFESLYHMGANLKNRISILFVDEFGLQEAGIDGGGVFKEFLTGLSHEAFDVNYGLFVSTPDQLLYPNPSYYAVGSSQLSQFEFLGLIIGKAVYEGILLDVPFADFFLKKCLGKSNYLDDLSSLDPELYKGLLSVKNFTGDVEDLSLDFTITQDDVGKTRVIELIPNGSHIPVTNQNRIQYIYLVANYRLNVQIAKQCKAFFRGLSTIVDPKWLRMFNQQELQVVLGGASIPIDLDDLRTHTTYAGFTEKDAAIQYFWRALESFDNDLRMKFVKFVTSCSRPPLLGFKELVPTFCIRNAGVDDGRLPTSSTCVNLLKLPNFTAYDILRRYKQTKK
ncbi:hypothetical protein BDB01DRAFT_812998 [Pilobolus umbonatus]|nr:hypothetical protein BDB01DRAFT_812998 [Pilobolus umbonatus]